MPNILRQSHNERLDKRDIIRELIKKLQLNVSPNLMTQSIADLRHNYTLQQLSETDVDPDPIKQFQ